MSENAQVTDANRRDILKKYAPRVWLAPDEEYPPVAVEWVFQNTVRFLAEDGKYWLRTKEPLDSPSSELAYFGGQPDPGPVYAFWVEKERFIDLVYFFNYAYNRGKEMFHTIWGNHVGDWEHIIVRLDGENLASDLNRTPLKAYLSAHDGGAEHAWDAFEKVQGTHPVTYSAHGSHAMYKDPRSYDYKKIQIPKEALGVIKDKLGDAGDLLGGIAGSIFPDDTVMTLTDECGQGKAWDTWERMELFDYKTQKNLTTGSKWPRWLDQDYSTPGDDASNPAAGPIFRWGNPEMGKYIDGVPARLEDGPTGPIDKSVWKADQFE